MNVAMASKRGGCVVWILRDENQPDHRMRLQYRFVGAATGHPIRVVLKRWFERIDSTTKFVIRLFGLECDKLEVPNNG